MEGSNCNIDDWSLRRGNEDNQSEAEESAPLEAVDVAAPQTAAEHPPNQTSTISPVEVLEGSGFDFDNWNWRPEAEDSTKLESADVAAPQTAAQHPTDQASTIAPVEAWDSPAQQDL